MVTNFTSTNKLKTKLQPNNKVIQEEDEDSAYINYNNLVVNSKVLNTNDGPNEDDDQQQHDLNSNNYLDSEQDYFEDYDERSQVTGNEEDEEQDEQDEQDQQEPDDENNNQINSISDYAEKLTEWTRSSTRRSRSINFDEKILYDDVIQVNCNSIVAELHKKKFGSGGKGRCIRVLVDSKQNDTAHQSSDSNANKVEKWMTPIEFETFCGKGNCRDWKRTIKAGGQQILALLDAEILTCHAVSCSCAVCNQNESLVGPIKPFMRYRRRKKDEILAQNAFKKFLSLKPPTLLPDCVFPSSNAASPNVLNATCSKTTNNILNNSNATNQIKLNHLILKSNNSSNNNNNSNDEFYAFSNSSNNSNSNNNINNSNSMNTNGQSQNMNNSNSQNINNGNSNYNVNVNNVNSRNPNTDDLIRFINKMQEAEEKKWSTLEQMANDMINQAKNLQSQIEVARKESELNKKVLIDKLLSSSPPPTNSNFTRNNNVNQSQMTTSNLRNLRDRTSLKRKLSIENSNYQNHQINYNNANMNQNLNQNYNSNGLDESNNMGHREENEDLFVINDEDENNNYDELDEDFFKEKKSKNF